MRHLYIRNKLSYQVCKFKFIQVDIYHDGVDDIFQWCVNISQITQVLKESQEGPICWYHSEEAITIKILWNGLWWSTLLSIIE